MQINIKEKDIKTTHSPSGMLIDELAYSAGEWTSEDLYENCFDYEPTEPYQFNYEKDLLENTQTIKDLRSVMAGIGLTEYQTIDWKKQGDLQAGAFIALDYPEIWKELLEAYQESLLHEGIESISKKYSKELEEEKSAYHDEQYREWLNGDHQNYAGVLQLICRYYGAESVEYDKKDNTEFTFNFDDAFILEELENNGYKKDKRLYKNFLLSEIRNKSNARSEKDKAEREKRRAENERVRAYRKEVEERDAQKRREELLSLKLK